MSTEHFKLSGYSKHPINIKIKASVFPELQLRLSPHG